MHHPDNRNRFVCLLLFSFIPFIPFLFELTNYSMKIYFDLEITQRDIIIVPCPHIGIIIIMYYDFRFFFCDCILSYYLVKTDEFEAHEFNKNKNRKEKRKRKSNAIFVVVISFHVHRCNWIPFFLLFLVCLRI